MDNKITIKCPDGYMLNQEDYAKGIISFVKEKFPTSWEDFCERFPIEKLERYIDYDSSIRGINNIGDKRINEDKNVFINREEAEKFLTLIQLRRIWQEYHKYEENLPDEGEYWYIIYCQHTSAKEKRTIFSLSYTLDNCGLFWFKSEEVGDKFLHYFKKELEQIKELF